MKEIKLTKEQVAIVDDDDYDNLIAYKWQASYSKNTQSFYAVRTARVGIKRKTISMHREIMKTPPDLECDHINHDTLDNRKENLRNCTGSENQRNRKSAPRNSKTGQIGITPERDGFLVQLKRNKVTRYIGRFKNMEDAISARELAEKIYDLENRATH